VLAQPPLQGVGAAAREYVDAFAGFGIIRTVA
jgi:hypothetical protein